MTAAGGRTAATGSPDLGTTLSTISRSRVQWPSSGAVASSAVLPHADQRSHDGETRQDDQGCVEGWDPPDLVTLYDVDTDGQDQSTESPTCARWRRAIRWGAIRRLRRLDARGVPGSRWFDRTLAAPAPTRHEGHGNDEKLLPFIGCTKGTPHRQVLSDSVQQISGVHGPTLLSLPPVGRMHRREIARLGHSAHGARPLDRAGQFRHPWRVAVTSSVRGLHTWAAR